MDDIFVQIEGNGVNNEVEIIKETNYEIVVRNINTNFIYTISISDFQKHYRGKKYVENRGK